MVDSALVFLLLQGGAFERTDLDLAGGVESDHHQGALRGDPQSLARSAQNVAVGELDEAKPKVRWRSMMGPAGWRRREMRSPDL